MGHLVINVTQSVFACSKSTIETQDQGLKSVQSYQWREQRRPVWWNGWAFVYEVSGCRF